MNEPRRTDLITEAERYLAAVAVFRAEGCEPHWRLEPGVRGRGRSAGRSALRGPLDRQTNRR